MSAGPTISGLHRSGESRKRPTRRAAEQRHELAPSHGLLPSGLSPTLPRGCVRTLLCTTAKSIVEWQTKSIVEWQRWVKLALSIWLSALPPIATEERTFRIGSSVPILLQKSARNTLRAKIGNNRIGANLILNQHCALAPDLDSILHARVRKIFLQQYLPIGDMHMLPVFAASSSSVGWITRGAVSALGGQSEFPLGRPRRDARPAMGSYLVMICCLWRARSAVLR